MKKMDFEILSVGFKEPRGSIKGRNIYYKCGLCGSIIPSTPKDSNGCSCGNVQIDADLIRLFVKDYSNFIILRKKE
ncbi:MAG: hypothetical protein Fur0043_16050 [Anaerolineales bacterium]